MYPHTLYLHINFKIKEFGDLKKKNYMLNEVRASHSTVFLLETLKLARVYNQLKMTNIKRVLFARFL